MEQTPVHEIHNPALLEFIPASSRKLIEIGCSSGALAREFKKISTGCDYLGIEIDPTYADLAKRYCDRSLVLDLESATEEFWAEQSDRDCWIFGDVLEHFRDPWSILRHIRKVIPQSGCVVVCIPNAQHWSLQAKLSIGDFRYENMGLLDKTHLRWFTRQTLIEMFDQTGFQIQDGRPLIYDEQNRDIFLPIIEQMAKAAGADPQISISDAVPFQYVIRAIPKQ